MTDFKFEDELSVGSVRKKVELNIKAIKTLQSKASEEMTNADKITIAHYSGWGGASQVFDETNTSWQEERNELKSLLSENDYESARSSVLDSFYTPKSVTNGLWNGLKQLGLDGSTELKILEPSAGTGDLLAKKPDDINAKFTAIELDNISHKILRALYPNQVHFHSGYEKLKFAPEFNAVIANPPFGSQKILDNDPSLNGLSIHNYFIAKSQKLLTDKGVSAYVVSSYFMDSADERTRSLINEDNTFLGAIRLPNNAFKNAHTDVMTDIVFFQKGKHQEQIDWLKGIENTDLKNNDFDSKIFTNEYFKNNPQNILGELQVVNGQYGRTQKCIQNADDFNLEQEINNVISNMLPKNIFERTENITNSNENEHRINIDEDHPVNKVKDHQYFIENNTVYFKLGTEYSSDGQMSVYEEVKTRYNTDIDRLKILIPLRDLTNRLYEAQRDRILSDDVVEDYRRELNEFYDKNITNNKSMKSLNENTVKRYFKRDVDAGKVFALEKSVTPEITPKQAKELNVSPRKLIVEKSDIFFKRTVRARKEVEVDTVESALIASFNQFGSVNLEWMAEALKENKDNVYNELLDKSLVFLDHETEKLTTPEKYLSGNVVKKLAQAQAKALDNPIFRKNVAELESVQPERIFASDISVDASSSWIPQEHIQAFISTLMPTAQYTLIKDPERGTYEIEVDTSRLSYSEAQKVSTKEFNVNRMLNSLFADTPIKIMRTAKDENGNYILNQNGKKTEEPNEEAILEARSIQFALKNEFKEWIWQDPHRRSHIEDVYNKTFNTHVAPKYNGQHLKLEELNPSIQLRKHQKDAVWRLLQEGSGLLDHVVGAGKTLASISTAMEGKKMGLHNKPLITVPNHLVYQWRDSIYEAYPDANILVPDKDDYDKGSREMLYGKIANNDWDIIIMPHSQFTLIEAPLEMQEKIVNEELLEIMSVSNSLDKESRHSRSTVKQLERRAQSKKAVLEERQSISNTSKSLDFSDLGVDALFVDEAHEFKNLAFTTGKEGILGLGTPKGSKMAMDLWAKTRWLKENNEGRGVYFLTGTPISNTIGEMFTLQRYLQWDELKEKGISKFDSWASAFGEINHNWELDSSGTRPKLVSRFNKFQNVPELMNLYNQFADVVDNAEIAKYNGDLIPTVRGNKPLNIVVPRTKNIANFIGVEVGEGQYNEGSVIWRMDNAHLDRQKNNMLYCTSDARKAGLDYRLIDDTVEDEPVTKINAVVDHVYDEYLKFDKDKGAQLVFCDLSVPKKNSQSIKINDNTVLINSDDNDVSVNLENLSDEELDKLSDDEKLALNSKFDVYSDILKKLVEQGIPQNEIRFIHDCKNDEQRAELFKKVNDGEVRVLIGSTAKMGAGMNVQKRLTAMHHVDCPWRPSDIEQRNGRGYRQGNMFHNNENYPGFGVLEVRYATQNTYDSRMWEVNEQKAKAIEQLRIANKTGVRDLEDCSSASANASQMKSASTGNPLMQVQLEIDQLLKQQERQYSQYLGKEHQLQDRLNFLENTELNTAEKKLESLISVKGNIIENEQALMIENDTEQSVEIKKYMMDGVEHVLDPRSTPEDFNNAKKSFQDQLKNKIDSIQEEDGQVTIFEYRGLTLKLDKTNQFINLSKDKVILNFELDGGENYTYAPANLEIQAMAVNNVLELSPSGLLLRVDNAINNIDSAIEKIDTNLTAHKEELEYLKQRDPKPYVELELLHALRKDQEDVLNVLRSKDEKVKEEYVPSYELLKGEKSKAELISERGNKVESYIPRQAQGYELSHIEGDNYIIAIPDIEKIKQISQELEQKKISDLEHKAILDSEIEKQNKSTLSNLIKETGQMIRKNSNVQVLYDILDDSIVSEHKTKDEFDHVVDGFRARSSEVIQDLLQNNQQNNILKKHISNYWTDFNAFMNVSYAVNQLNGLSDNDKKSYINEFKDRGYQDNDESISAKYISDIASENAFTANWEYTGNFNLKAVFTDIDNNIIPDMKVVIENSNVNASLSDYAENYPTVDTFMSKIKFIDQAFNNTYGERAWTPKDIQSLDTSAQPKIASLYIHQENLQHFEELANSLPKPNDLTDLMNTDSEKKIITDFIIKHNLEIDLESIQYKLRDLISEDILAVQIKILDEFSDTTKIEKFGNRDKFITHVSDNIAPLFNTGDRWKEYNAVLEFKAEIHANARDNDRYGFEEVLLEITDKRKVVEYEKLPSVNDLVDHAISSNYTDVMSTEALILQASIITENLDNVKDARVYLPTTIDNLHEFSVHISNQMSERKNDLLNIIGNDEFHHIESGVINFKEHIQFLHQSIHKNADMPNLESLSKNAIQDWEDSWRKEANETLLKATSFFPIEEGPHFKKYNELQSVKTDVANAFKSKDIDQVLYKSLEAIINKPNSQEFEYSEEFIKSTENARQYLKNINDSLNVRKDSIHKKELDNILTKATIDLSDETLNNLSEKHNAHTKPNEIRQAWKNSYDKEIQATNGMGEKYRDLKNIEHDIKNSFTDIDGVAVKKLYSLSQEKTDYYSNDFKHSAEMLASLLNVRYQALKEQENLVQDAEKAFDFKFSPSLTKDEFTKEVQEFLVSVLSSEATQNSKSRMYDSIVAIEKAVYNNPDLHSKYDVIDIVNKSLGFQVHSHENLPSIERLTNIFDKNKSNLPSSKDPAEAVGHVIAQVKSIEVHSEQYVNNIEKNYELWLSNADRSIDTSDVSSIARTSKYLTKLSNEISSSIFTYSLVDVCKNLVSKLDEITSKYEQNIPSKDLELMGLQDSQSSKDYHLVLEELTDSLDDVLSASKDNVDNHRSSYITNKRTIDNISNVEVCAVNLKEFLIENTSDVPLEKNSAFEFLQQVTKDNRQDDISNKPIYTPNLKEKVSHFLDKAYDVVKAQVQNVYQLKDQFGTDMTQDIINNHDDSSVIKQNLIKLQEFNKQWSALNQQTEDMLMSKVLDFREPSKWPQSMIDKIQDFSSKRLEFAKNTVPHDIGMSEEYFNEINDNQLKAIQKVEQSLIEYRDQDFFQHNDFILIRDAEDLRKIEKEGMQAVTSKSINEGNLLFAERLHSTSITKAVDAVKSFVNNGIIDIRHGVTNTLANLNLVNKQIASDQAKIVEVWKKDQDLFSEEIGGKSFEEIENNQQLLRDNLIQDIDRMVNDSNVEERIGKLTIQNNVDIFLANHLGEKACEVGGIKEIFSNNSRFTDSMSAYMLNLGLYENDDVTQHFIDKNLDKIEEMRLSESIEMIGAGLAFGNECNYIGENLLSNSGNIELLGEKAINDSFSTFMKVKFVTEKFPEIQEQLEVLNEGFKTQINMNIDSESISTYQDVYNDVIQSIIYVGDTNNPGLKALNDYMFTEELFSKDLISIVDDFKGVIEKRYNALANNDQAKLDYTFDQIEKALGNENLSLTDLPNIDSLDDLPTWKQENKIVDPDVLIKDKINKIFERNVGDKIVETFNNRIPKNISELPERDRLHIQRQAFAEAYKSASLSDKELKGLVKAYSDYSKEKFNEQDRISVPKLMQFDTENLAKNFEIARNTVENFYQETYGQLQSVPEEPRITKTRILFKNYPNLFEAVKEQKNTVQNEKSLDKPQSSSRGRR